MLPTGLIFGIPDGYHLEVNVRGGTGLKRGLRLANSTGIIDDDYVEETFLLIQNVSGSEVILFEGERLCQAHLVKNEVTELCEVFSRPERKTVRAGGFNSTGKF
jgi:dUTP pyrophosphatase